MEQIFLDRQVSQIVIPLDEYKELIETKGRYEELKRLTNLDHEIQKDNLINKKALIKYLDIQYDKMEEERKKHIDDKKSEIYITSQTLTLMYNHLKQQIVRNKIEGL